MWTYEIVFEHPEHPDKTKVLTAKTTELKILMTRTTEVIASENDLLVLDYVKKRLREFKDYELVAVIRRHPIIQTLKEKI